MSSNVSSDFIVNPFSGRLIKKNSKTYQRLVNAKLLNEEPSTPEQNIILKTESADEAKEIQGKLNKNLQKNKVITRRGNTVLKANRRPTRVEIIDKVSNIATEVVRDNRNELLESEMDDNELDQYIKDMIQNKLIGNNVSKASKKPIEVYPKKITTRYQTFEERMNQSQNDNEGSDPENDY